jgi:type I restriction enzyme S subunit
MNACNGWAPQVPLGEVVRHRKEFIEINDLASYKRCRVQLHAKGVVLRDEVEGAAVKTKKQQVCRPDEFLVAEIDAKMGGFGIVPPELDGAIVSSHYFLFDPLRDRLDPRFLDYYCRTPAFRDQVTARGSTNYAAIRPSHVLGYTIPLPPLAEQRRIVAKIERLAGKIEEARVNVDKSCAESDALFAVLLRQQFCGSSETFAIEDVADVRGGIQKGPHRAPGNNPVRYLTVAHVQRDRILTDDPRYFQVSQEELERWRLLRGDVLIIEGNGSAEQIGRTALFRGEVEDCVHQNHVIRVRADTSQLLPEFLNAFLNSPAGQELVQQESRTTSGLRTLSVGRIKKLRVPTPSIGEQMRVIAEVDRLRGLTAELDRMHRSVAASTAAIMTSILDRTLRRAL